MSLIKKLGNYKYKNYLDDIIDDSLYNNEIKIPIKINIIKLNDDVLTSIKIIENQINIIKYQNIKLIEIHDESVVNINSFQYNLSIYCILLTGYPFYTRYGFISIDHDQELLYNKKIRNLPLNIFINKNKFKKFFQEPYFNNPIKNIMKYINQYLKINNGKLKHNNPIVILLLEIIEKGKQLVKYNNKLIKNCL
jgi:hypothetical protein